MCGGSRWYISSSSLALWLGLKRDNYHIGIHTRHIPFCWYILIVTSRSSGFAPCDPNKTTIGDLVSLIFMCLSFPPTKTDLYTKYFSLAAKVHNNRNYENWAQKNANHVLAFREHSTQQIAWESVKLLLNTFLCTLNVIFSWNIVVYLFLNDSYFITWTLILKNLLTLIFCDTFSPNVIFCIKLVEIFFYWKYKI